jgi:Recombination endonuclease VII
MATRRRPTRRKQLGLSLADYDTLLAAQEGHCALCPATPKSRRLHVDHDHRTGLVRGLLCHRCNRALPNWITPVWLTGAAAYLTP